jgi:hypothetical protein
VTEEEANAATGNEFRPQTQSTKTSTTETHSSVSSHKNTEDKKQTESTNQQTSSSERTHTNTHTHTHTKHIHSLLVFLLFDIELMTEKTLQLDLLFRKTKTKPHLYWLPLTEEEVIAKRKNAQRGMKNKHHLSISHSFLFTLFFTLFTV